MQGTTEYTDYRSYNINDDLRNGKYLTSEYKQQIDSIDRAISKFDLPQDIKVYRGTNIIEFGKYLNDFNDVKGLEKKTLKLPAFTSTSTNFKVADIDFNGEVLMEISVKAGKGKGAYVDFNSFINPNDKEDRESEFLLKRNTEIKINKVKKREDGKIIVEAEA